MSWWFPPAILKEIERVLRYPRIAKRHGWSDRQIEAFLDDFSRLAIGTRDEIRLNVIRTDPSDNRYLECAVEGEAAFIETGDSDLLRLGEYRGVRVITPSEFWQIIGSAKQQ